MQQISPKLLFCRVQPVWCYPDPGWVLITGKSVVKRAYPKETPPFISPGLMLRVLWKQLYRNLILVPVLVFSHPLPLPGAAATDFSPSWVVTSSQTHAIWTIFGFFISGGHSSSTVWPQSGVGGSAAVAPAAPGCKTRGSRSGTSAQLLYGSGILLQEGRPGGVNSV